MNSSSIDKLTEYFREFPGIGPRQAKRFVYFLLTRNNATLSELSRLISELKKDINVCESCFRFYQRTKTDSNFCPICGNPNREKSSLMIVSRDVDLENIEKTHSFNGLYFVLGGSVPILDKNPETRIRSKELERIIKERAEEQDENKKLKEIIIAVNATPEGEHTGDYVEMLLKQTSNEHGIKISHLGRGISTGTELEYSDSETIKNALKNRQ